MQRAVPRKYPSRRTTRGRRRLTACGQPRRSPTARAGPQAGRNPGEVGGGGQAERVTLLIQGKKRPLRGCLSVSRFSPARRILSFEELLDFD
jgi:hypothetical protein